jgi:RND superfamily putative drug exporter
LRVSLRSYRHMAISLVNLIASLLLSFAILVPISDPISINPFAPSIMMSLGIAVCFDYSLFMLTRYRETIMVGKLSKEDGVFEVLLTAGHVVVLSGCTLFITFILLLVFPQNFLQSVGWSCGSIVLASIMSNMTLTPNFAVFDPFPSCITSCKGCPEKRSVKPHDSTARGFWFRSTFLLTKRPWLVLGGMVLLTIPFVYEVVRLVPTSDDVLLYLLDSPSLNTLELMTASFDQGKLSPYSVVLVADTGNASRANAVFTEDYFAAENKLVHAIITNEGAYTTSKGIAALSYFADQDVSFAQGMDYFNPNSSSFSSDVASAYRVLVGSTLNADQSASMIQVVTTVPPNSQQVIGFIKGVRAMLDALAAGPPQSSSLRVNGYLFGGYTTTLDVQNALYALVPAMVGSIVALIIIVVGGSFRSVLLGARLLVTIALSLVWTYGLMVAA